jgi:hypothetical protein
MPNEKKANACAEIPCVALGEDVGADVIEAEVRRPESPEEEVTFLREQVVNITAMLDNLFLMVKELREKVDREKEKIIADTIEKKKSDSVVPEGTVLHGTTRGMSLFLQVRDGGFWVNNVKYDSLSAAAEAVSGVRRSGWAFWKFADGRTVRETLRG